MNKVIVFLFVLHSVFTLGQVKVASHPLHLNKSKEYHQIISTADVENDNVFVFATDKEKTTIVRYNAFLFFKDSLVTKRPNIGYKNMVGYSFGKDENPTLYWADPSIKNLVGVHYDMVSKKVTTNYFQIPIHRESILHVFNENNNFYILTQKRNAQALVLYVFKDGIRTQYLLDFSNFEFLNSKKEAITLSNILAIYPLEKIDTRSFNPLFKVSSKSKFYVRQNDILITFDHNFYETQMFQLDFKTIQLKEQIIPQYRLNRLNGLSNSLYHENKWYQLTTNEAELHFGIKEFETGATIREYHVAKNDTITFTNSPLYSQIRNQKPKVIKTTAKFLKQLSTSDIGISVYKTPQKLLLNIGGNSNVEVPSTNYINSDEESRFETNYFFVPYNVYFEFALDKKGNPIASTQFPLAIDFIGQFSFEHPEAILSNTFKHKNYYIHGYYDAKLKQFIMLKFYDGF